MALYPSTSGSAGSNNVSTVSPSQFETAIREPGIKLIDLRTAPEFASGHLAGASELDFYASDFPSQLEALDKNASYAIYCHTGNRSGQAAALMQKMGFKHVINLQGGIAAWEAAGLPITTQ